MSKENLTEWGLARVGGAFFLCFFLLDLQPSLATSAIRLVVFAGKTKDVNVKHF